MRTVSSMTFSQTRWELFNRRLGHSLCWNAKVMLPFRGTFFYFSWMRAIFLRITGIFSLRVKGNRLRGISYRAAFEGILLFMGRYIYYYYMLRDHVIIYKLIPDYHFK